VYLLKCFVSRQLEFIAEMASPWTRDIKPMNLGRTTHSLRNSLPCQDLKHATTIKLSMRLYTFVSSTKTGTLS
jgi:hypothetical protein